MGHEADRVQTGAASGFVLATYAALGQMVKLHAEAKGYPVYEELQQAGDTFNLDPACSIEPGPHVRLQA